MYQIWIDKYKFKTNRLYYNYHINYLPLYIIYTYNMEIEWLTSWSLQKQIRSIQNFFVQWYSHFDFYFSILWIVYYIYGLWAFVFSCKTSLCVWFLKKNHLKSYFRIVERDIMLLAGCIPLLSFIMVMLYLVDWFPLKHKSNKNWSFLSPWRELCSLIWATNGFFICLWSTLDPDEACVSSKILLIQNGKLDRVFNI